MISRPYAISCTQPPEPRFCHSLPNRGAALCPIAEISYIA